MKRPDMTDLLITSASAMWLSLSPNALPKGEKS